ncbi:MAG: PAS domain-containing protein [Agriterribacter sp.]
MGSVPEIPDAIFLDNGGTMGKLMREFDWSDNPLGNPGNWPVQLKTLVGTMLEASFPMLICWSESYIQLYNDPFRPILGSAKHPAALGKPASFTYAEIWAQIGPMFEGVLQGKRFGFPNFLVRLERNEIPEDCYFDFSYSPVRDENGVVKGILVVCIETTEKVLSLRQLQETNAYENSLNVQLNNVNTLLSEANTGLSRSQHLLEFTLEAAEIGTWDLDPRTGIFTGNTRLQRWFGLDNNSEIPLQHAIDSIAPKDRQRVMDAIAKAVEPGTGGKYDIGYEIYLSGLGRRFVQAKGLAQFDDNNQCIRFSGILMDVTPEAEAAEQLRVSQRELEYAYEQMNLSTKAAELGRFDMDLLKGTLQWDNRCRLLFGISHTDPITYEHDFVNGLHPEDRPRIIKIIDRLFEPGSDGDYDVEYRTVGAETGIVRWVRAKGKVIFNEANIGVRFIGAVLDITETKLYQQQLQEINSKLAATNSELQKAVAALEYSQLQLQASLEKLTTSELQFRNLIGEAPVAIALFRGEELVIEEANKAMLVLLDRNSDIIGKPFAEAVPELIGQPYFALLRNVLATGEPYFGNESQASLVQAGVLIPGYFNFIYQPLKDDADATTAVMAVAINVTEQVTSRLRVQQAEQMVRFAIEASNIGTYSMDARTRIFTASPRLKELFGFGPSDTMSFEAAISLVDETDRKGYCGS